MKRGLVSEADCEDCRKCPICRVPMFEWGRMSNLISLTSIYRNRFSMIGDLERAIQLRGKAGHLAPTIVSADLTWREPFKQCTKQYFTQLAFQIFGTD